MVCAAIDVGTNSVLLTVGRRTPEGGVAILEDCSEITRLGEGVDRERVLRAEAMERTAATVARFTSRARELGAQSIRVVGTSACRDARNIAQFRALLSERALVALEVLSGEEEAQLSYQAVRSDGALGLPEGDLIVVDVGGGSAEVIHGDEGGVRFRASVNCGAVRATERFLHSDPPTAAQMAGAVAWMDSQLASLPSFPPGAPVVGIGGTFVNLAAVRLGLPEFDRERVHGVYLDGPEVERQIALFASMPVARRREIPGLEPKRADVILAGALLVRRILARLGAPSLCVSARGLRYGALFGLLGEQ